MREFFERVGEIADPIRPVMDFVAPMPQEGESPGGLINGLSRGLSETLLNGPIGLMKGVYDVASNAGEMSGREKLLYGGLLGAGTMLTAHQAHKRWRMNAPEFQYARSMSSWGDVAPEFRPKELTEGYEYLTDELDDRQRFRLRSEAAQAYSLQRPGLAPRQLEILVAEDEVTTAIGLGRWDPDDFEKTNAAATFIGSFMDTYGFDLEVAQTVAARLDRAMESKKFPGDKNSPLRAAWKSLVEDPETLLSDPEKSEMLMSLMRAFHERTDGVVGDAMELGIVGQVDRFEWVNGELQLHATFPQGWTDGSAKDKRVRAKRFKELNHSAIAVIGTANLDVLFRYGRDHMKLDLGEAWYPTGRDDVAKVFGLTHGPEDEDALDRAVAAVSFLSEAELWETNVAKAKAVFDTIGDITDPEFQAWLRKEKGVKNAKAHAKRFKEIHLEMKQKDLVSGNEKPRFDPETGEKIEGFYVSEDVLRKVLRLKGGEETVEAVFRTSDARKQKNFYTNLRYPELSYPLTVDRHAYDAFFAMDTGIDDRPIYSPEGYGDQVYDVIADAYRALAHRYNVPPHAVQAVVWEAWRVMKFGGVTDGWKKNQPYRMPAPWPDPETGRFDLPNPIYEALNGRGALPGSINHPVGPLPVSVLESSTRLKAGALETIAMPDGTVALASDVSDATAATVPHLTPLVLGADGTPHWGPVRPRRFRDLPSYLRDDLRNTSRTETFAFDDMESVGGHPAVRPGPKVVVTLEEGRKLKLKRALRPGRAVPLGRAASTRTALSQQKLGPEDIAPESLLETMDTTMWATISAELSPEQLQRFADAGQKSLKGFTKLGSWNSLSAKNALRRELVKRGYKPIEGIGRYGGVDEDSFLVLGMTPDEALEIGERFGQDSVLTNNGFLYNREFVNDPATLGMVEPIGSIGPVDADAVDDFSEVVVGGVKVRFTVTDAKWGEYSSFDPDELVPVETGTAQRVEIPVKDESMIAELGEYLENHPGVSDVTIYSSGSHLDGWERAYEEVASDGAHNVVVSRNRTGATGSPHGRHVFVRSAEEFAAAPEARVAQRSEVRGGQRVVGNSLVVDGNFGDAVVEFGDKVLDVKVDGAQVARFGYADGVLTPLVDAAEAESGRFEAFVTKSGVVSPVDDKDVTGAARAWQDLSAAGVDVSKMKTGNGEYYFPNRKDFGKDLEVFTAAGGVRMPPPKIDDELDWFTKKHGFGFDPAYRAGNSVERLPDRVVSAVDRVTEGFMADHWIAAYTWRLPMVVVSPIDDPKAYSALRWSRDGVPQAGGEIQLSREWWSDPERLEAQLIHDRANGVLSPRVSGGLETLVAHEYGHVLHGAILASEGMIKDSHFEKELREKLGRQWKKRAQKEISETAADSFAELVAESYTEVAWGKPSKMAREVYDLTVAALDRATFYQREVVKKGYEG